MKSTRKSNVNKKVWYMTEVEYVEAIKKKGIAKPWLENTPENQNADQPKDNTKIDPDAGREQDRQMYRTYIRGYPLDKHILSWLEQNYMVAGVEELWKYMMHELNQCFIEFAIERNEEMINEDLISNSPEMFLPQHPLL